MHLLREDHVLVASDGGRSVVHRIAGEHCDKTPVVMLPGMFSAASFWISDRDIGLAAHLAERGHPCWIHERRRLGASLQHIGDERCGMNEALQHDLPMLQGMIADREGMPAVWMGHSFGGMLAARGVAGSLDQAQVAGCVLFATQYQVGKPNLSWPALLVAELFGLLFGHIPGRRLGLGTENEPLAAIRDARKWMVLGRKTGSISAELRDIHVPVLAMVGAGDTVDPPSGCRMLWDDIGSASKTFELCGTAGGYHEDYSHPGILVSRAAREDIWPGVANWLDTLPTKPPS